MGSDWWCPLLPNKIFLCEKESGNDHLIPAFFICSPFSSFALSHSDMIFDLKCECYF